MIPDLGKYAAAVGWSYAVSLVLLLALVWLTRVQGKRVKRALRDVEKRQGQGNSNG